MPRKNQPKKKPQPICVAVSEETADGIRKITLEVQGAAEDFLLGDLLAQRNAIPRCADIVGEAAREAAIKWLEGAESVVAGTRNEENVEDNKVPKRDHKPKVPGAPEQVSTRRVRPEVVKPETANGAIVATSSSAS
jgi:hypothetical protein